MKINYLEGQIFSTGTRRKADRDIQVHLNATGIAFSTWIAKKGIISHVQFTSKDFRMYILPIMNAILRQIY